MVPDPNFPDLDGNGIPDNLPNPDEEVTSGGGGGGGGEGDDDESSASFAVTFEGLARACAGGLGDDVHAFTIMGTAEKPDGSRVPGATLQLSFENNRGRRKARHVRPRCAEEPDAGAQYPKRRDDGANRWKWPLPLDRAK